MARLFLLEDLRCTRKQEFAYRLHVRGQSHAEIGRELGGITKSAVSQLLSAVRRKASERGIELDRTRVLRLRAKSLSFANV